MKTKKQRAQIFLVLVPHRDIRLVLRNYSAALFRAGFDGAYNFPWVAPLAVLSRPLNAEELKRCARSIREAAGNGKINAGQASYTAFPVLGQNQEDCVLYGPRLDISIPRDIGLAQKAADFFSPPVIGACLLPADGGKNANIPSPPELSFRAAAVANMYWRTLPPYDGTQQGGAAGYKWKIGKLRWLAPVKKKA
jgi:hypothetical protein